MGIAHPSRHNRAALLVCAALLGLFAVLSYSAALRKSATYDEPYHAVAAWIKFHLVDFRMDYEDPPLTHYWVALPAGELRVDTADATWQRVPQDSLAAWELTRATLYHTPENDPIALINRERFMSLLLGVGLGAVIAIWAWQLAGGLAAMLACLLFALDPNFLAHASLVKNDVAAALMLGGLFFALWRAGQKLTLTRAALVVLWCAAAMNTKFSAILIWPIMVLLLGIRVLMPQPWPVLRNEFARAHQRLITGAALLLVCAAATVASTWTCYGFRFSVAPDPNIRIDPQVYRLEMRLRQFQSVRPLESYHPPPAEFSRHVQNARAALAQASIEPGIRQRLATYIGQADALAAEFGDAIGAKDSQHARYLVADVPQMARLMDFVSECAAHPQPPYDPFASLAEFLLEHRLMPEAWTSGMMFHYAHATLRRNFLLGQISEHGWWYYFPLAMLFKTPLATLAALAIAAGLAILNRSMWKGLLWPAACLIVPPLVFMAAVMRSSVNLGVRHVLPVYPFLYLAAACLIAPQLPRPRWRRIFIGLAILLACETLFAWPNYIAYFNWMCMGPHGGIHLLGDSNLDWGQDLPALAKWQHDHGDPPIALAYFGTADPAEYGVRSGPLPFWPPTPELRATHVLAISATGLQGIYNDDFIDYSNLQPTEVLGGTIYLYDLRPRR